MIKITKLTWDTVRPYDMGLSHGVLYSPGKPGEAWNGLVSLVENEADSVTRPLYLDGFRVISRQKEGRFAGTIGAFTYPDSFYDDVLTQKRSRPFGLSYRTETKLHILYNVLVSPSPSANEQRETGIFSWPFTTRPIQMPEGQRSAHLVIDTSIAYSWTVTALEEILYGSSAEDARLPDPTEVLAIFEDNSILQVIDHGDGSFTVTGPDDAITMLDETTFQITWPSATYLDAETYTIHSL